MKLFIYIISLLIAVCGNAQTTLTDGSYTNTSNWAGGLIGGSYNGTNLLTLSTQTIFVNNYMILGSYGNNINVSAVNSNDIGSININDTLIVYGNMTFANKSMALNVGSNGVLIILGDLDMNNKIDVDSDGLIVVSGTFTMSGSEGNNTYAGTGGVYAGAYGGNAASVIDDATDPDASYSTSELGTNGFPSIESFITNGGATPLPITLKEFKVAPTISGIALNWTTLSEENFEYFEIQRAAADGDFSVIQTVAGNGFSKDEISYSWADENPRIGINYYRLESVDFDGYRETFPAVSILFEPENRMLSISPNPIIPQSVITLKNTFGEDFKLRIIGLDGVEKIVVEGTDNKIQLPSSIKKGIYLAIFEVNGLQKTQKLIVR